ncbi:MAG: DUF3574 domain-containing protein [Treponema sp.]|nr:DUF3574 domain-containing protein [Treponema sp.]
MKDAKRAVSLALSTIAVVLAALSLALAAKIAQERSDIQYVIYLGTNDATTKQPPASQEAIKKQVEELLVKRFAGYTIVDADGGWTDGAGNVIQEHSLAIYLSCATSRAVHDLADELLKTFNQRAVLIQANKTTTEFYTGK